MEAIGSVSKVLNVQGEIIPASLQPLTLLAEMDDGTIVRGESNIPIFSNRIRHVFYDSEVEATPEAIDAIVNTDIIVFGVGSLYTSILPNVIIPGIKNALQYTKAKKLYYCNVMTQPGETDSYNGEEHVQAILSHMNTNLDYVIADNSEIPEEVLAKYQTEDSTYVAFDDAQEHPYTLVYDELTSIQNGLIRHDHEKIEQNFRKILEVI